MVDLGSERRLSVEVREERAGADMVVEAAGKNGWRKATAAAMLEAERLRSRTLLVIQEVDRVTRW